MRPRSPKTIERKIKEMTRAAHRALAQGDEPCWHWHRGFATGLRWVLRQPPFGKLIRIKEAKPCN